MTVQQCRERAPNNAEALDQRAHLATAGKPG
jgi:hypothetical protein